MHSFAMMKFFKDVRPNMKHSLKETTPPAAPTTFMLPLGHDGQWKEIAVTAADPVWEVKQRIANMTGLSIGDFVLECGWDQLDSKKCLLDYDIVDGGEPVLVQPLC